MVKRISAGILALALMTSCVSKKVYTDLETKYADLKKENRALADQNTALEQEKNQLDLQSKDLQAQLEGTENRIAVERGRFNEVVRDYNTAIRRFPAVLFAGMLGFETKAYFQSDAGAEKAPDVKFDFGK